MFLLNIVFVKNIREVKHNIERFNEEIDQSSPLNKKLKTFQQWYYVKELNLFAPSKYIGYQNMNAHLYEKVLPFLDGRETVEILKKYFQQIDCPNLEQQLREHFEGRIRRKIKLNVLKSEHALIEEECLKVNDNGNNQQSNVEDDGNTEGMQRVRDITYYERDSANRRRAIEIHGLQCKACGFDFEKTYGERGRGFIEVHHIEPLSTLNKTMKINPKTDLIPLCANCHRMIHRKHDEVLSIEQLRNLIELQKSFNEE